MRHVGETTAGSSRPASMRGSDPDFCTSSTFGPKPFANRTPSRIAPPDQNFNSFASSPAETPNTNIEMPNPFGLRNAARIRFRSSPDSASWEVSTASVSVLLNRDIARLTASGDANINGIKLEAIKAYQPPDCFFFNGVQTLAADQNTFHLIHRWVISSPLF